MLCGAGGCDQPKYPVWRPILYRNADSSSHSHRNCVQQTDCKAESESHCHSTLGVIVPHVKVKYLLLQQQRWRTAEERFQCKFCFLTDSAAYSPLWFRNLEAELGVDEAACLLKVCWCFVLPLHLHCSLVFLSLISWIPICWWVFLGDQYMSSALSSWWRMGCALALSHVGSESPGLPRPEKERLQLQPSTSSRMESWAGPAPGLPCAACATYCPKRVDSGCEKVPEAWEAQTKEDPMHLWCLLWGQLISVRHCADKDRLFLVLKLAPPLPLTDAACTLCYIDTACSSSCVGFCFGCPALLRELWGWMRLKHRARQCGHYRACPESSRLEISGALCRNCPSLLSSVTQKSWRVCSYSWARRWNVYSLIHFFCQKHGVKTLPALTTTFFTALFVSDGSATLLVFSFSEISENSQSSRSHDF